MTPERSGSKSDVMLTRLLAVAVISASVVVVSSCGIHDPTEDEDFLAIANHLARPVVVEYCKNKGCRDFWWKDTVQPGDDSSDSVAAVPGTAGRFLINAPAASSARRCLVLVRFTRQHPKLTVSTSLMRRCRG
jgi:hypothetical protein